MGESVFPMRTVEEMVENHDSRRVPVKASNRKPGPYPYYGAQGIVDYVDDYIFDGQYVLVAEDGENLRSRNEPIALMANGKFWVNNHAHVLKGSDIAETRFVYYAINQADISGYVSGSTIPKLSQKNLNALLLPCPAIDEQRRIVQTLGALDDKIALNRRTTETMEAMARAIFRDWFVDFGPTRAKMARRSPYLAPELWSQFPEELDHEGIPDGWRREALSCHVHVERGISYSGRGLTDKTGGIPLHNLNSILEGGGYKYDGLKWYSGEYRERHLCAPGDLLVANTEQGFEHLLIGYAALVPDRFAGPTLFSHHLYRIKPHPESWLTAEWLCFLMNAAPDGERIRKFANGTTVNMLPSDAFAIPQVTIPTRPLVEQFSELAAAIRRKQESARGESDLLAKLRDELLPRFFGSRANVAPGSGS